MTSKQDAKPSQDEQPPTQQPADSKPKTEDEAKKEEYSVIGNFTVGKLKAKVDRFERQDKRQRYLRQSQARHT
jgi:hypothetical protein